MSRVKACLVVLCCAAAAWASAATSVSAQTDSGDSVTRWIAEVEGGADDAALSNGTWFRLGVFNTQDEAEACVDDWNRRHPNSLRLTNVRSVRFSRSQVPPSGSDQLTANLQNTLNKILNDDVKKPLQTVGDAARRAREAGKMLRDNVDGLARDDFRKINRLVDRLNNKQGAAQLPAANPAARPQTPGFVNQPPRPAPVGLANSTWRGNENLQGYSALSFAFHANGSVTMYDRDGAENGSWQQSGNQVTLTFYNGGVRYQGTVQGNRLSGTASNQQTSWQWSTGRN